MTLFRQLVAELQWISNEPIENPAGLPCGCFAFCYDTRAHHIPSPLRTCRRQIPRREGKISGTPDSAGNRTIRRASLGDFDRSESKVPVFIETFLIFEKTGGEVRANQYLQQQFPLIESKSIKFLQFSQWNRICNEMSRIQLAAKLASAGRFFNRKTS